MKLSTLIATRPILVLIILALVILLLPSLVISLWYRITKRIKENVEFNTENLYSGLVSEVESIANMVQPLNSSAINLARFLSSSINQSEVISFNEIETKVAPILFQAFSTITFISQISYVGLGGLSFSYYVNGNQTFAMYSNSSLSSNSSAFEQRHKHVYKQLVDNYSGKLYGEAVKSHYLNLVNTSWFQAALMNGFKGYSSVEKGWNGAAETWFLNSASVNGKGVVSLAFPVKKLTHVLGGLNLYGGFLSLATKDGKLLFDGIPNAKLIKPNGEVAKNAQNLSCLPSNGTSETFTSEIGGKSYKVQCSPVEISGVQLVYALGFPDKESVSLVEKNSKHSLILLVVVIVVLMISIFSFVFLMIRTAEREMCLYAKLIKQMEATQQAERKSMNKSNALAGASHDIRASLAGITGLIDVCLTDVAPRSDIQTYLNQMRNCAQDLLGLLNSILDTSKIEAGMMNLEEEEFNLAELLEHVVDLYHPVGMRKGVDVVLDPCDGSVIKFSQVKGDRGKLLQVISNVISNAVKFTSEGHVTLRAWVQKPNFDSTLILASSRNGIHKYLSCFFQNNNEAQNDMEVISAVTKNPNSIEFVFEVDDTGKGIPKEKQKSVFENFVQVKETAAGQVGTGLGLGIVQSLVRLMGGEIGIIDKDIGEKGTCFRFNVFLTTSETSFKGEKEIQGDLLSNGTQQQHLGLTIHTPSPSLTIRTPSPKLNFLTHSPKLEGSQVVLLIKNDERRRISHKFMENLGINVSVVDDESETLHSALKKIKSKLISSQHSSRRSELSSKSDISSSSSKDLPLSAMDGTEQKFALKIQKGAPSFILLVIDPNAEPFPELWRAVDEFRKGLQSIYCKVVWLGKPKSLERERLDPGDEILLQPFHGSRLYRVVKLLPEFGGILSQGVSDKPESSSMAKNSSIKARSRNLLHNNSEIQEEGSSSNDRYRKKNPSIHQPGQIEIKKDDAEPNTSKQPLSGKRVLIAEDDTVLRRIAGVIVGRLGARFENCENGEEALQLVCTGLQDQRNDGGHFVLPYDYILMDCEMPLMNGYEATRQIRKQEKHYGVHIPIIALTAHTSGVEARKTLEAGMDAHLGKPLQPEALMETIEKIHKKGKMLG